MQHQLKPTGYWMFMEKVDARCEKVGNSETHCVDKLLIYLMLEQMMHVITVL
jgi:hypothetical protein